MDNITVRSRNNSLTEDVTASNIQEFQTVERQESKFLFVKD